MRFWLVKGKDGKVYLTQKDEEPTRRDDYSTGWNIGWPGTAYVDNDVQMYGLFAVFFEDARNVINKADFPPPQFYEDDPVEVELDLKMHWYGR